MERCDECGFGYDSGLIDPIERTIGWMGLQAIHECEHHADDIAALTR